MSDKTTLPAPSWENVIAKLDALERSCRENTERMVELRLAAEQWVRLWKEYQRGR